MKNKNNKKTEKGSRPTLRHRGRVALIVTVLILITALIALAIRMFGGVDMSSSDISDTSTGSTSAAVNDTTTTAKSSQATPSTSSKATSTTPSKPGEHYVQPAGAEWNLKLVNPWNPIEENYNKSLVTYAGTNKYDSRAIDKLKALINAGRSHNLRVASLYRTIELQTKNYNREVSQVMARGKSRTEAENIAASVVARPWTSEHHLGLAVDFLFEKYSSLETSYENTDTYDWMMENCADYGFILRFPKNKQSITGVIFEPWHYRYVGEEAAHEIMSRSITLEEYLQEKGK